MLVQKPFQPIMQLNEAGSADQFAYKLIEDNSSNMAQKMIYIPACVSFCMPLINLGINSIFSSIQQIAATKRRGVRTVGKKWNRGAIAHPSKFEQEQKQNRPLLKALRPFHIQPFFQKSGSRKVVLQTQIFFLLREK